MFVLKIIPWIQLYLPWIIMGCIVETFKDRSGAFDGSGYVLTI